MQNQTFALEAPAAFTFEPQDRKPRLTFAGIAAMVLSLLVMAAAVYQASSLDLRDVIGLIPRTPLFWVLFVAAYLAGPVSEWFIFRKLWQVGPAALAALLRKMIYNELLVGYLGEVYFYGWARKSLKLVATPFGAVKDVAVLSAMAGNVMTLLLLIATIPFVIQLPIHEHGAAVGWSLAFVMGSSLAIMVWRGSIFSLERGELWMVFAVHIARIVAITLLSAWMWSLVLPETPAGWWLLLVTIRLLISRLPFVPNKDVVFAGVAVLVLGENIQLVALMALMAGLIVLANMIVGLSFALFDIFSGARHEVQKDQPCA